MKGSNPAKPIPMPDTTPQPTGLIELFELKLQNDEMIIDGRCKVR